MGSDLQITETFSHDWAADPFTRGAWTYRRAGVLSTVNELFGLTHGRTFFCGADVSTGLNWVDGGIADGLRVAAQISGYLGAPNLQTAVIASS